MASFKLEEPISLTFSKLTEFATLERNFHKPVIGDALQAHQELNWVCRSSLHRQLIGRDNVVFNWYPTTGTITINGSGRIRWARAFKLFLQGKGQRTGCFQGQGNVPIYFGLNRNETACLPPQRDPEVLRREREQDDEEDEVILRCLASARRNSAPQADPYKGSGKGKKGNTHGHPSQEAHEGASNGTVRVCTPRGTEHVYGPYPRRSGSLGRLPTVDEELASGFCENTVLFITIILEVVIKSLREILRLLEAVVRCLK